MITVVGLGAGDPESLTVGALNAMSVASSLRLTRDPQDPAYVSVAAVYPAVGYDAILEGGSGSGDDHERAARRLVELSTQQDIVYIVPGDPLRDDPVSLFLAAGARSTGFHLTVLSPGRRVEGDSLAGFQLLVAVMARLRNPERGCPWDNEQTLLTLKRFVLEEAYEVLDAIDQGDPLKHSEELGDLLLQVVFQAQLAQEAGKFGIDDVILSIVDKLIRRHPHVFGDISVTGSDQVVANWEAIKRAEPGYEDRSSILDGIPTALPALMRAMEVSKRVVKVGFEWPEIDQVLDKVEEEIGELRAELKAGDRNLAADELGDLLFTLVNVARKMGADPEEALRHMTIRFAERFKTVERHAADNGRLLADLSLAEMEEQWSLAKSREKMS